MERAFQRCIACRGGAKKNSPSLGMVVLAGTPNPPFFHLFPHNSAGSWLQKTIQRIVVANKIANKERPRLSKTNENCLRFFHFSTPTLDSIEKSSIDQKSRFFFAFFHQWGVELGPSHPPIAWDYRCRWQVSKRAFNLLRSPQHTTAPKSIEKRREKPKLRTPSLRTPPPLSYKKQSNGFVCGVVSSFQRYQFFCGIHK